MARLNTNLGRAEAKKQEAKRIKRSINLLSARGVKVKLDKPKKDETKA